MKIKCPKCGAESDLPSGVLTYKCEYCTSSLYLDKRGAILHYILSPTIDRDGATANLKRWMASPETVKNLELDAVISSCEFFYFPLWYFKIKKAERQHTILKLASATSYTELKDISIPAGDLKFYNEKFNIADKLKQVSVPFDVAVADVLQDDTKILEQAIVHIPVFSFTYNYKGDSFYALVEGATGKVLANIYPSKSDVPFFLVTFLACLVYFLAGIYLVPKVIKNEISYGSVAFLYFLLFAFVTTISYLIVRRY